MNSVNKLKVLFSGLSLALVATAPFARAQDMAPSAAPSAAAPADTPPPPPPRAKKGGMRPDPLNAVSNVTDDQKAKAKAIREATRSKIEALPDDDNKREAMGALMKDQNAQIRALLTDDQKTEYDAAVKKMMKARKKKGPDDSGSTPPPPPPPGA